jgi:hypothetical protein
MFLEEVTKNNLVIPMQQSISQTIIVEQKSLRQLFQILLFIVAKLFHKKATKKLGKQHHDCCL